MVNVYITVEHHHAMNGETHEINGHFQVRLNFNSHYQRVKHLKTSRNRGFTMIYPLIAWIFHFAMSTCQRWPGTSQVHGTNFLAHVTIDLAEHNSGFHGIFGKKTGRFSWKIDIFMAYAWPTWLVVFRHPSEKWWSEFVSWDDCSIPNFNELI